MIRFSRVAVAVHLSAAQQIFSALLPQQNAVPLEKTPGIGPEALRGRDSNPRRMFFRHRSTLLNYRARQHLTRHVFSLIFSIRCVFAFPGMASCIHCSLVSIYSLSGLFRIRLQLLRMQRRQRFIREATITHYRNAFGRSCKYPYDAPMEKADHTIYGITIQSFSLLSSGFGSLHVSISACVCHSRGSGT